MKLSQLNTSQNIVATYDFFNLIRKSFEDIRLRINFNRENHEQPEIDNFSIFKAKYVSIIFDSSTAKKYDESVLLNDSFRKVFDNHNVITFICRHTPCNPNEMPHNTPFVVEFDECYFVSSKGELCVFDTVESLIQYFKNIISQIKH